MLKSCLTYRPDGSLCYYCGYFPKDARALISNRQKRIVHRNRELKKIIKA